MQVSQITGAGVTAAKTVKTESSGFGEVLGQAFDQAREAEAVSQQTNAELLSGGDTEIHTAMIAAQKAELTLNFAIQVRNKVVEAYNEVMRMQV